MALTDCREPVYDKQVENVLRMLEEGMERAEIATKLGYNNPSSLDNYMRRRNFSWDSREKMFVPAAERYNRHNNVLPMHGVSKATLVISLFAQGNSDPKEVARQVGFETHTQLANHMGAKGYEWDSTIRNYVKKDQDESPKEEKPATITGPVDEHVVQMLDRLTTIVQTLEDKGKAVDADDIPRYQVQGFYGTKGLRLANILDQLSRRFSIEKNISQREIFEVALIEFFQKYGYKEQVEEYLL